MKLALIGYGKMGKMIEKIAQERGHEIVCKIDTENQSDFDSDAFRSADVAIEFTSPQVAYGNCVKAFEQGVKVVSGTTGWLDGHREEIQKFIDQGNTLFWASNFSLGVAIFSAVNTYLAKIMNQYPSYEVAMEETHHVYKLDAPSGTAITLAESIIKERADKTRWELKCYHKADGTVEEKTSILQTDLPITAYRRDEVPGIHTITYDSPADTITISHSAHNRTGFALGAVLAAEYTTKHKGLLSMSDLFNF